MTQLETFWDRVRDEDVPWRHQDKGGWNLLAASLSFLGRLGANESINDSKPRDGRDTRGLCHCPLTWSGSSGFANSPQANGKTGDPRSLEDVSQFCLCHLQFTLR